MKKVVITDANDDQDQVPQSVPTRKSIAIVDKSGDEPTTPAPVAVATEQSSVDQSTDSVPLEPTTAPAVPDELIAELAAIPPADETAAIQNRPDVDDTEKAATPASPVVNEPEPVLGSDEHADAPIAVPVDDDQTTAAVDDIVAEESDLLLDVQDAAADEVPAAVERLSFGARLKLLWLAYWYNSYARWGSVIVFVGGCIAVAALPVSRYAVLNTVGVRSRASIQIIDQSTQQPLKDVAVTLDAQSVITDNEGRAQFSNVHLGAQELTIKKRAFAAVAENITVGWGANPLGNRALKPIGMQYSITVTDYLSGKPVKGVAAEADDSDAVSNDNGVITLTFDKPQSDTLEVRLNAAGYRAEKLTIRLDESKQESRKLVPVRKSVFVSKRSGTYDIYAVDVDGQNERRLLQGTGTERDDIQIIPHPSAERVAIVSTRDGKRNNEGYLLSTLTVIDVSDGSVRSVTQSEQVNVAGWSGDRLVYVQIAAGTSAANPNRQRLMSYDYAARDAKQLASTNYFNDVMLINGRVFYAPSGTYQTASAPLGLFRVNVDGTNRQTIIGQETWNIFRTSYDAVAISVPNEWYEYKLDAPAATKLPGQPSALTSHSYVDSPNGKRSLWVDNRDGKGVLLAYDSASKRDQQVQAQSGLTAPIRWLSDTVAIYRVKTDQETADYALSLDGGKPVKIRDVTSLSVLDRWYYY